MQEVPAARLSVGPDRLMRQGYKVSSALENLPQRADRLKYGSGFLTPRDSNLP